LATWHWNTPCYWRYSLLLKVQLVTEGTACYWRYSFLVETRVTIFFIIKRTRCTNFSNLFWEWNSTCFRQFLCPSSGLTHCKLSNGSSRTYTIAECTVSNSWWWTEELSETCRVSFPKWIWEISASSWFYYKEICQDARSHECKIRVAMLSFVVFLNIQPINMQFVILVPCANV
jgi:hypothetical protein